MSLDDDPKPAPVRRGRPPGTGEPVTVVSVSMDPSTLRQIDKAALKNGRTRSAWVRWVLMSYIRLKREREAEKAAEFEPAPEFDRTHGGRFDPALNSGPAWACRGCKMDRIVAGWLFCPGCGATRGPNSTTAPESPSDSDGPNL